MKACPSSRNRKMKDNTLTLECPYCRYMVQTYMTGTAIAPHLAAGISQCPGGNVLLKHMNYK